MMYVGREMRAGFGAGCQTAYLGTHLPAPPARTLAGCEPRQGAVEPWPGSLAAGELVDSSLQRYVPALARPDEMPKYPHLEHNYIVYIVFKL